MTDPVGAPLTGGILVICTANVCRSPLGAALVVDGLPDATVTSAGVHALDGAGMCPVSAELLPPGASHHHVAAQLTADMIAGADLVLAMEREQRSAAVRLAPGSQSKVFTLREAAALARGLAERGDRRPDDAAALATAMHRARGVVQIPPPEPTKRRWWSRPAEPEDPLTIVDGHGRSDEEHHAAARQVEATTTDLIVALGSMRV